MTEPATPPEAGQQPLRPPEAPRPAPGDVCSHPTFCEALAHAQSDFPVIPKGKTARIKPREKPEYTYDYADLADIIEAVKPILFRCGLSISQPIGFTKGGQDYLQTILMHPAGRLKSRMRLTVQQSTPQATGSLITYYRRYAYCAILGIVSEADDDGSLAEAAYGADAPRRRRAPRSSTPTSGRRTPTRARGVEGDGPPVGIMSAKNRNDIVKHYAKADPPVRGNTEVELAIQALMKWDAPVTLSSLTVEQGGDIMDALGIAP